MAWALLLNSTKVIGSRYCTAVCTSMPCMKNAPSPAITTMRRPGARLSRGRTPSRCRHRSCSPCRPCRARPRTGPRAAPAGGGSPPRRCCRRRRRCRPRRAGPVELGHGVAVPHTLAVEGRRGQLGVRHRVGHPKPGRPPGPERARVSIRSDARRSSVWTWVQARYGGAEPMDTVGTAASASSRPARAVTDSRVPTTRHSPLPATASDTPGDHDTVTRGRRRTEPRCSRTSWHRAHMPPGAQHRTQRRSSARASSRATCSPAMMVTGRSPGAMRARWIRITDGSRLLDVRAVHLSC